MTPTVPKMDVRNSGYSNFYTDILPEGNRLRTRYPFPITATPISLSCATATTCASPTKGEKEEPFTVSDVLDESFRGMSGWVSGYIVGSVRLGVNEVKDAADVILSDKAEMDNNLLIAASPDEKDWQKMVVVELPQEQTSVPTPTLWTIPQLRYGKSILVNGTLSHVPRHAGCDTRIRLARQFRDRRQQHHSRAACTSRSGRGPRSER